MHRGVGNSSTLHCFHDLLCTTTWVRHRLLLSDSADGRQVTPVSRVNLFIVKSAVKVNKEFMSERPHRIKSKSVMPKPSKGLLADLGVDSRDLPHQVFMYKWITLALR